MELLMSKTAIKVKAALATNIQRLIFLTLSLSKEIKGLVITHLIYISFRGKFIRNLGNLCGGYIVSF